MTASATFKTEADLCAAFLTCIPAGWTAYPETCGWDIVLVHDETGIQIGIEAKLVLNTKVLVQAAESAFSHWRGQTGPDFRAVLIDRDVAETRQLAGMLGLKILQVEKRHQGYIGPRGTPKSPWAVAGYNWLPDLEAWKPGRGDWYSGGNDWTDWAPPERMRLPEYVPRVAAGVPAPRKLSSWTIQAIKLCILVDRIETVSRAHFNELKLSPSRWCDGYWLTKRGRGFWGAGPSFPGQRFKSEHPEVWAEIEAAWDKWGAPLVVKAGDRQGALL